MKSLKLKLKRRRSLIELCQEIESKLLESSLKGVLNVQVDTGCDNMDIVTCVKRMIYQDKRYTGMSIEDVIYPCKSSTYLMGCRVWVDRAKLE
jgi:hypothetical protein